MLYIPVLFLGFPCLMVVLSLVIASKTDDGIMSYVHSDL